MLHLLRLEWLKFRKYRVFQVMIVLFAILLPGTLLIGKSIDLPPELGTVEMFYIFPSVWKYLGYAGNWLAFFFLGFMGVLSITNEYSYKTFRQNIISGLSRRSFFLSKLIFALAISLAATLYFVIVGLSFGFSHSQTIYYSKIFEGGDIIFRFFLMCMGYLVFGLFIGTLVRKTGLALFIYLIYIMFLESVIRWAVHYQIFPGSSSMHYYPMNALEDLVPVPFAQMATEFSRESKVDFFLNPMQATLTTLVYLSLFLLIIHWRIRRADI